MKKRLSFKKGEIENIIKEEEAFTLKKTKSVQKDTGKFNDDYYKDVTKKFKDYNEPLKATEKENSDAVMKYTNSEDNQEYHDEYEILNGLEMTIYGNDPGEKFKDRAEKAIAGDPTMGNDPEWANVVTADQAGFTGPEFGKNLIDRIKNRQKKSDSEAEKWNGMGDVAMSLDKKPKKPNMAISENKKQVKMKRLRFKTPFSGVENALKLIPESYKVDNKTFQMTDGNEKYEIRWEGNINEGRAIILKASDKVLMNEDMQKMKHLMQYNSKDTLGNLRGKERINENKVFNDVWNKTKSIKESSAFGFGFTNEGNLEENEEDLTQVETKEVQNKIEGKAEELVKTLSSDEAEKLKNILDNLGVTPESKPETIQKKIETVTEEILTELTDEEKDDLKKKVAKILFGLGVINLLPTGGMLSALIIHHFTNIGMGTLVPASFIASYVLTAIAGALDKNVSL